LTLHTCLFNTENSENYKRESATTDDINLLISEGEEGQTSDEIKWHLVSILQIHYFEFMQKYIFLYNRPGNEAISVFNPSMEDRALDSRSDESKAIKHFLHPFLFHVPICITCLI